MTARPSLASIAEAVSRKPRKPRDGNAEARVQAACIAFVRAVAPDCLVFAVPNGGLRSKSEASRMRWTGTLAGVPDMILLAPGARAIFIEVKADKGRLSPEQSEVIEWIERLGFSCWIVRSVDDMRAVLQRHQIKTREAA